jgi:hypothetical protein
MDFIDADPIAMLPAICTFFEDYQIEIHQPDDDMYAYLEEGDASIIVQNPFQGPPIMIDLCGEFTLSFGDNHCHFENDAEGYNEFLEEITGILANNVCSASIFCGPKMKWYGSIFLHRKDLKQQDIEELFEFVLREKEVHNMSKIAITN